MSATSGPLQGFVGVETAATPETQKGKPRPRIVRHFNPAHLVSVEYRAGQSEGLATDPALILTFVGGLVVELSGADADAVYAQLNAPPQDQNLKAGNYLGQKRRP